MSLHLGEQPSIKDDNTQIRVENQEKEKKDMQTQMNRTKNSMGPSGGYIGSGVVKWLELMAGDNKAAGLIQ